MIKEKLKLIGHELKNHAPFTILGAVAGIIFLVVFRRISPGSAHTFFSIAHPLHVVLSAMVTAALFELHRKAKNFLLILLVGVVGSIGIATLSDSVLPYFGETILGAAIPTHAALHEHGHEEEPALVHDEHEHEETAEHEHEAALAHEHGEDCEHGHEALQDQEHDAMHEDEHAAGPRLHLGFIEEWYLVFPAAILGVLLAYFRPQTKWPHASHVLLSTWASASHMLMNTTAEMSVLLLAGMFIVLFLAVWLPCCVSDIVFPMLFVRGGEAHVGHNCVLCGKKDKHKKE